jgi:hypothetical protein
MTVVALCSFAASFWLPIPNRDDLSTTSGIVRVVAGAVTGVLLSAAYGAVCSSMIVGLAATLRHRQGPDAPRFPPEDPACLDAF